MCSCVHGKNVKQKIDVELWFGTVRASARISQWMTLAWVAYFTAAKSVIENTQTHTLHVWTAADMFIFFNAKTMGADILHATITSQNGSIYTNRWIRVCMTVYI